MKRKPEYTIASAPGKVILFGEHFVVKGSRSLAAAISLRVRVKISKTIGDRIEIYSVRAGVAGDFLHLPTLKASSDRLKPLVGLLDFLTKEYGINLYPARVEVESDIPIGAGLGSSAAFAVAFALAYSTLAGVELSRDDLVRASYESEKIAHGKPSGIDNTLAVYGGGLVYRIGCKPSRINISLPKGYSLVVADTGVPRSTRMVVESVLSRAERLWPAARLLYEAVDSLVDLALEALKTGNTRLLGELMDFNEGLLYSMGASSSVIERMLYAARSEGALGAKLTGAGWGGSIIVLVSKNNVSNVLRRLLDEGAREAFEVSLGGSGALLEEVG